MMVTAVTRVAGGRLPADTRFQLRFIGLRGAVSNARALFHSLTLQLSAGGEDIAPTWSPDRACVSGAIEHRRESFDRCPVGTFITRAGPRIERNEIDLGRNSLEQAHERLGLA